MKKSTSIEVLFVYLGVQFGLHYTHARLCTVMGL
jgi:hypothetical protein